MIPPYPILILGIGNVLLKDEGIGVHVVRRLQHAPLPPGVEVVDGGTMGLDLLWRMEDREKVILIDVVRSGEPPGTVFRFHPGDIARVSNREKLSFHQAGLFDMLKIADLMDKQLPEMIIIAIEPKDISMGTEPTPELAAKIPYLADLVMKEIPTGGSQM